MKKIYLIILQLFFKRFYETRLTAAPITFKTYVLQKILGFNRKVYWPVHFTTVVTHVNNIKIGIGTAPGLSHGCYIQGGGKIYIGDYTIIGPNVGIISANHELYDNKKKIKGEINIGNYCWIGMNSTIMPNVNLGDYTIVGSGAVVTKSFPDGFCVIAGNPAKIIKKLKKEECHLYRNDHEYYGYIKKEKFGNFRKKKLNV